jgi:hypothetical protein
MDIRNKLQVENLSDTVNKGRLKIDFPDKWWTINFTEYDAVGDPGKYGTTKGRGVATGLGHVMHDAAEEKETCHQVVDQSRTTISARKVHTFAKPCQNLNPFKTSTVLHNSIPKFQRSVIMLESLKVEINRRNCIPSDTILQSY